MRTDNAGPEGHVWLRGTVGRVVVGATLGSLALVASLVLSRQASGQAIAPTSERAIDPSTGRVDLTTSSDRITVAGGAVTLPREVGDVVSPGSLKIVGDGAGITVLLGDPKPGATLVGRSLGGQGCVVVSTDAGRQAQMGCGARSTIARKGATFAYRDVKEGVVSGGVLLPEGATDVTVNGETLSAGTRAVTFRVADTETVEISFTGRGGRVTNAITPDVWR